MFLGDRSPSLKIGWVLLKHRMHPTLDWISAQWMGAATQHFAGDASLGLVT